MTDTAEIPAQPSHAQKRIAETGAVGVSSFVQNEPKFRRFRPENADWAEKRPQTNPILGGGLLEHHGGNREFFRKILIFSLGAFYTCSKILLRL